MRAPKEGRALPKGGPVRLSPGHAIQEFRNARSLERALSLIEEAPAAGGCCAPKEGRAQASDDPSETFLDISLQWPISYDRAAAWNLSAVPGRSRLLNRDVTTPRPFYANYVSGILGG
jgi:hypothetical protein